MITNVVKNSSFGVGIRGLGAYLPDKVITNYDLAKSIDTSDEWIKSKIGVHERRRADDSETLAHMATEAGRRALENSGVKAEDIDLIILARVDPDHIDPSTSFKVQHNLGAINAGAFDAVVGGCPGSVYALSIGTSFVASGGCKNVLVIGGDIISRNLINWDDRETCCFFGDGVGAAVLSRVSRGKGIQSYLMEVDGSRYDVCIIPAGGLQMPIVDEIVNDAKLRYLNMNNRAVWDFANTVLPESITRVAKESDIEVKDIDMVISHQANINIIRNSLEKVGLNMNKTHTTIEKYGNTGGASTFITLAEAVEEERVKPGDKVAIVSFGAGLAWAGMLLVWNDRKDFV
ncbi:3-oxoacyl-ACP synthase III family protein [Lutispora sp.]|uniref:3-oxoacyl-ACP synthase III family protein n=1 Tax=Lutispora sp. TaxID=2828727 RepID=UPI002B1F9497|nr:ketoacyl-ACP synthase III [Lutispora sp.]MEA4962243.1 ketoacyl-ACP synthase III [Lutispora sp.]